MTRVKAGSKAQNCTQADQHSDLPRCCPATSTHASLIQHASGLRLLFLWSPRIVFSNAPVTLSTDLVGLQHKIRTAFAFLYRHVLSPEEVWQSARQSPRAITVPGLPFLTGHKATHQPGPSLHRAERKLYLEHFERLLRTSNYADWVSSCFDEFHRLTMSGGHACGCGFHVYRIKQTSCGASACRGNSLHV